MKYITIVLLLLVIACENNQKKDNLSPDSSASQKDMEVYIDENSLIKLGDISEIWVKRVFPDGKTDNVTSMGPGGKENVFAYDGIASLVLFDCKQKSYILDQIYYFMGDKPVTDMQNRKERLEDRSSWSKVGKGDYMEKVYNFVCKPEAEE